MSDIFFTYRVSGGDESMQAYYDCIRRIVNNHNTEEKQKPTQSTDRTGRKPNEIYGSVMNNLMAANYVTYSSLGVGYEIGYAQCHQYKILCLFCMTPTRGIDQLSPMIRGASGSNFHVEAYENEEDLEKILKSYLTKHIIQSKA